MRVNESERPTSPRGPAKGELDSGLAAARDTNPTTRAQSLEQPLHRHHARHAEHDFQGQGRGDGITRVLGSQDVWSFEESIGNDSLPTIKRFAG